MSNPVDIVRMDIPLLIRVLEYVREEVKTDVELHNLAENLIKVGERGNRLLKMRDYEALMVIPTNKKFTILSPQPLDDNGTKYLMEALNEEGRLVGKIHYSIIERRAYIDGIFASVGWFEILRNAFFQKLSKYYEVF